MRPIRAAGKLLGVTAAPSLPKPRILICDEMQFKPEQLKRDGFQIEYVANMPRETILSRLHEFDALITRSRTKVDDALRLDRIGFQEKVFNRVHAESSRLGYEL